MEIIEILNQQLEDYNLLSHPMYKAWSAGTLTIPQLQEYAKQYYHHVAEFPRYLSLLHSKCKSLAQRQILLANLRDEEEGEENHPELWLRFAEGLGIARSEVAETELYECTQRLIDGYHELASSYARGLGALYAYERQVPEVAKSKIEGLERHYGITEERVLHFFRLHIGADEWHSQECADLIAALPEESQEEARMGAIAGAKLLWQFLDGMPFDCATA